MTALELLIEGVRVKIEVVEISDNLFNTHTLIVLNRAAKSDIRKIETWGSAVLAIDTWPGAKKITLPPITWKALINSMVLKIADIKIITTIEKGYTVTDWKEMSQYLLQAESYIKEKDISSIFKKLGIDDLDAKKETKNIKEFFIAKAKEFNALTLTQNTVPDQAVLSSLSPQNGALSSHDEKNIKLTDCKSVLLVLKAESLDQGLRRAAANNYVNKLQFLLQSRECQENPSLVNKPDAISGMNALHWSIKKGHVKCVELLLNMSGIDLDQMDKAGRLASDYLLFTPKENSERINKLMQDKREQLKIKSSELGA